MVLLLIFGFVAGAATALSPCVLPVLPVALSAGATGGRRRPLGIVAGLAVSFTFATVALVYVIDALGLPNELLRNLAIAVLLGFGVSCWCRRSPPGWRPGSAASPPAPGRRRRRRLLVRDCGRRQPRLRLRALRRPDPRRRDHRLRLAVFTAGRLGVALSYGARLAARPLLPDARRAAPGPSAGPPRRRLQVATGAVMVLVALAMLGELRHSSSRRDDRQRPARLPRQPDRRASRTPTRRGRR